MMTAISKHIKDESVLRRLLFAVSQLAHYLPDLWKITLKFATEGKEDKICDSKTTQLILKNLEKIDLLPFKMIRPCFLN